MFTLCNYPVLDRIKLGIKALNLQYLRRFNTGLIFQFGHQSSDVQ